MIFSYFKSIFDNNKIKPVANELVERLRKQTKRSSLDEDSKPAERTFQLMLDLARDRGPIKIIN